MAYTPQPLAHFSKREQSVAEWVHTFNTCKVRLHSASGCPRSPKWANGRRVKSCFKHTHNIGLTLQTCGPSLASHFPRWDGELPSLPYASDSHNGRDTSIIAACKPLQLRNFQKAPDRGTLNIIHTGLERHPTHIQHKPQALNTSLSIPFPPNVPKCPAGHLSVWPIPYQQRECLICLPPKQGIALYEPPLTNPLLLHGCAHI